MPIKKLSPKIIESLKEKMEKEKTALEHELQKFAIKNEKIPGDWKTKFPHGNSDSGSASLERAADEVEEYSTRLPVEHSLELKLKDISDALARIKKGSYGKCEKCGKAIPLERLEIFPEARYCVDCQKK